MTSRRTFDHITTSLEYRQTRASLIRTYLHKKANTGEARLLHTAALLTVRASLVAADGDCTADELVKVVKAAQRARDALAIAAAANPRKGRARKGFGTLAEARA
jgi:hypothetical protein